MVSFVLFRLSSACHPEPNSGYPFRTKEKDEVDPIGASQDITLNEMVLRLEEDRSGAVRNSVRWPVSSVAEPLAEDEASCVARIARPRC